VQGSLGRTRSGLYGKLFWLLSPCPLLSKSHPMMRAFLVFCGLLAGCSGSAVTRLPAASVPTPRPESSVGRPPPAPTGTTKEDPLSAVPAPPPECVRLEIRHSEAACGTREQALTALGQAWSETDPEQQNRRLGELEGCEALEPGLVLALRAELAPAPCGDLIVNDAPTRKSLGLAPAVRDALKGLAIGAKLSRLVRSPPTITPPHTKQRLDTFIRGTMASWVTAQAQAIGVLAREGSKLEGYAKGVAAIEAGMADMRFVDVFRSMPLPDEFAHDPELADAYYSSLDQGLEPRKGRGRDAALVGLRMLAEIGVLRDHRVLRARALLSKLYNGRRIDALDGLLLPPLFELRPTTREEHLAVHLPTFYADRVLGASRPISRTLLRALLERGLPAGIRTDLDRQGPPPELRLLYARGLFELGRTYWCAAEFGRARALAAAHGTDEPESRLLLALGLALEQGPRDAAAMMLRGPWPEGIGNTTLLETLGNSRNSAAGMAVFDAALIRELVPPEGKNPGFFSDLAVRYTKAASLLGDPRHREIAHHCPGSAVNHQGRGHRTPSGPRRTR
jgi:hypothetical protein